MTADQNPRPGASDVEKITSTILTAVEKQLTRYFAAISQQVEAVRQKTDLTTDQLRTELLDGIPRLEQLLEQHRVGNEQYQQALQAALEERLAEFANHQHWRMNDLEDKVAAISTELPAEQALDPDVLLGLRQSVRDDVEQSLAVFHRKIEEFANTHRRLDDQGSALVQHVNETTTALTMRMDEGDQRTAHALEERLNEFNQSLHVSMQGARSHVDAQGVTMMSKLESLESRATDRLLELEQRVKDEQGTKLASLEATVGRIGSGFDDAMIAVNQRVLALENRLYELDERMVAMTEQVSKVDEEALEAVRSEISTAVGEAMLVRIELDRAMASADEKFDRQSVRMSEIEGLLTDTMDVTTSVQLERLDELERQMRYIDPNNVTLSEVSAESRPTASPRASARPSTPPESAKRQPPPSMSLNPRLPGADTTPAAPATQSIDMAPTNTDHSAEHTLETESSSSSR